MCNSCKGIKQRKVLNKPSYEELLKLIDAYGNTGTGKLYDVSEACIRKWLKQYKKQLVQKYTKNTDQAMVAGRTPNPVIRVSSILAVCANKLEASHNGSAAVLKTAVSVHAGLRVRLRLLPQKTKNDGSLPSDTTNGEILINMRESV